MHSTPSSALSPVQAQVAAALAAGSSITATARKLELSRQTIYNWLQSSPEFAEACQTARIEFLESIQDTLNETALHAIEAIQSILADPKASPAVKLRAALAVLNRSHHPDKAWSLPSFALPVEAEEEPGHLDNNGQKIESPTPAASDKFPRNALCHCGSGLKFKRCCLGKPAPEQHASARAA